MSDKQGDRPGSLAKLVKGLLRKGNEPRAPALTGLARPSMFGIIGSSSPPESVPPLDMLDSASADALVPNLTLALSTDLVLPEGAEVLYYASGVGVPLISLGSAPPEAGGITVEGVLVAVELLEAWARWTVGGWSSADSARIRVRQINSPAVARPTTFLPVYNDTLGAAVCVWTLWPGAQSGDYLVIDIIGPTDQAIGHIVAPVSSLTGSLVAASDSVVAFVATVWRYVTWGSDGLPSAGVASEPYITSYFDHVS